MRIIERIDIAILGAVPQEVQRLETLLANSRIDEVAGGTFRIGEFQDQLVLVGTTGIGKVNAAIGTAALLTGYDIGQIWNIGCAGCFEQGELKMGDVLITDAFLCGDEGVLSTQGVQSVQHTGISLVTVQDDAYFDALPASFLVSRVSERLPAGYYSAEYGALLLTPALPDNATPQTQMDETFQLAYGPSLSVGMASGDRAVARQRYHRYRALAENMEGSAIAQTCLRFGKPFVECRGMSNTVGERNKRRWRMEKAVTHCHAVLLSWLNRAAESAASDLPTGL